MHKSGNGRVSAWRAFGPLGGFIALGLVWAVWNCGIQRGPVPAPSTGWSPDSREMVQEIMALRREIGPLDALGSVSRAAGGLPPVDGFASQLQGLVVSAGNSESGSGIGSGARPSPNSPLGATESQRVGRPLAATTALSNAATLIDLAASELEACSYTARCSELRQIADSLRSKVASQ